MASFNRITIVGYLGRDPELRSTPQGMEVCNFSVATTDKKGDEEITTWFKVTVWGKQAAPCANYLAKGKQVYVDGRLSQSTYKDKEGVERTSLEVNASTVQFLGSNGERSSQSEEYGERKVQPKQKAAPASRRHDDDIPF